MPKVCGENYLLGCWQTAINIDAHDQDYVQNITRDCFVEFTLHPIELFALDHLYVVAGMWSSHAIYVALVKLKTT